MQGKGKIADDTVAWSLGSSSRREEGGCSSVYWYESDIRDGVVWCGVENKQFPVLLSLRLMD